MTRLRTTGLRARLLVIAIAGSIVVTGALVAGFNLVLDARLRGDADNLLRDRAAAQLRTLSILDGRLRVQETADSATPDTQTWVFAGTAGLEQPVGDPRNQAAAAGLARNAQRFATVMATHTRLYAVPVLEGSRRVGVLVVGLSLTPYENSARTTLVASLIFGVLIVGVIAAMAVWTVGRALAPVAEMTAKAADWGEHNLFQRFYGGEPHDELTTLAATFDQLLERLAGSLRREQRFTAEISHELRTPLAKIIAEAELAAARERSPAHYRAALDSIRIAAEQLGSSLDALLAAARTEAGATASTIDARLVAERATEAQRVVAQGRGIHLEVLGTVATVRVGAGEELLERTLSPLLDNAVRHARHAVQLGVSRRNGALVFEIHDDGAGVDPAILERIFEPGVTGQNGTGSGAGLGLALARRLARAAGGDVQCESGGAGATFSARFPLA